MYVEKVKLFPTKEQAETIDNVLWELKNLYNRLLEYDNEHYQMTGKSLPKRLKVYEDIRKEMRKNGEFKCAPAQAQQNIVKRLKKSFDNFFNPKHSSFKHPPKFKSIRKFRSFEYPQVGNKTCCQINFSDNEIYFSKLGKIKAQFSRSFRGTPSSVVIKKMKTGVYMAFIRVREDKSPWIPRTPENSGVIGIDLGVRKFLVASDGNFCSRPRFTNRHYRNQLKRAQRKLSRMVEGSKNWWKQKNKLAKLHAHVANQRRDHHFKIAHYLVTHYQTIVVEDLDVSNMLKKNKKNSDKGKLFRKLLSSVALYEFMTILKQMCQKYGCQYIGVDPRNTSQMCSRCKMMVPKTVKESVHKCPHCGLTVDRDLNASWNILRRGTGLDVVHSTVGTTGTITLVEMDIPGLC